MQLLRPVPHLLGLATRAKHGRADTAQPGHHRPLQPTTRLARNVLLRLRHHLPPQLLGGVAPARCRRAVHRQAALLRIRARARPHLVPAPTATAALLAPDPCLQRSLLLLAVQSLQRTQHVPRGHASVSRVLLMSRHELAKHARVPVAQVRQQRLQLLAKLLGHALRALAGGHCDQELATSVDAREGLAHEQVLRHGHWRRVRHGVHKVGHAMRVFGHLEQLLGGEDARVQQALRQEAHSLRPLFSLRPRLKPSPKQVPEGRVVLELGDGERGVGVGNDTSLQPRVLLLSDRRHQLAKEQQHTQRCRGLVVSCVAHKGMTTSHLHQLHQRRRRLLRPMEDGLHDRLRRNGHKVRVVRACHVAQVGKAGHKHDRGALHGLVEPGKDVDQGLPFARFNRVE
mmetsp:Transcript_3412/g.10746  ORF Transcript_3412/g.10746 Transcript_3412/m.10746 type:complete len:399 (-) Transcript_3412:636-1832(-)